MQEPVASTSTSALKERRFKLSRACDRCRRRRIKCDEGHPCQACLMANSSCTFEETGKRSHPHKSKRAVTLEDRMHHIETLIKAIPPAVFAVGGAMPQIASGYSTSESGKALNFVTPFTNPGVPPPSLHVFPLVNPSTHFTRGCSSDSRRDSALRQSTGGPSHITSEDQLSEEMSRMSLTASYLYFDDEGYTRWQGETSGLPVLDLLVEKRNYASSKANSDHPIAGAANTDWFPDRQPRRPDINPQSLWKLIVSHIVPELMDSLVQCFLSTSSYIMPFLHVPTFLSDYGNPQKWAEPGFAAFIVAICCLASRHMDDARVRADPNNSISAGVQWFELFKRLHTVSIADRPTLYNIQANLIAAVYAVGSGKLTKASALLAEACTMCVDAGLHRSADNYDLFDSIEDEVRKRTFWCVYIWDKQMSAHFGRPSILRLRDCDVGEPAAVDDEYITREAIGVPPSGTECRMSAFIIALRIMVVLESVLDAPPARSSDKPSSFLLRATNVLHGGSRFKELREEEALLDDIHRSTPPFWAYMAENLNEDTICLTQAVRLHCTEHFVRLLIYRHRFSELIAERINGPTPEDQLEGERAALGAAHNSAVQVIAANVTIATRGLMTYYGVHVIHQLTQAGRTLVAVLLCCKTETLQHLIPSGLDALRSCISLLRRFSSRYVCGLRSGDLMEEFCRLTGIPLETSHQDTRPASTSRPPWIRPVRKKATPSVKLDSSNTPSNSSQHDGSLEAFSPSDFLVDTPKSVYASGPASPASPTNTLNQPQFSMAESNGSTFDNTPGILCEVQNESQMYFSPEMLELFNAGAWI